MFWTDWFALAFAKFYPLTRSVDGNADVHTEDADFRVILDAWDIDMFF